jgi:hypothetical protein
MRGTKYRVGVSVHVMHRVGEQLFEIHDLHRTKVSPERKHNPPSGCRLKCSPSVVVTLTPKAVPIHPSIWVSLLLPFHASRVDQKSRTERPSSVTIISPESCSLCSLCAHRRSSVRPLRGLLNKALFYSATCQGLPGSQHPPIAIRCLSSKKGVCVLDQVPTLSIART